MMVKEHSNAIKTIKLAKTPNNRIAMSLYGFALIF